MKLSSQLSCYESQASLFLKSLKKQDPKLEQKQRAGRALLWDKPATSLDEQERRIKSTVKQQAYVYQNKV